MERLLQKIGGLELATQTPDGEPGISLDIILPPAFPFEYTDSAATMQGALQKKYDWIMEQLDKKIWVRLEEEPQLNINEITGHIDTTHVVYGETYLKCYRDSTAYFLELTVHGWIILGAGDNFINGRFSQSDELDSIKIKLETGPLPENLVEVRLLE